ncbi:MAG: hypothetical protein R8G66_05485 [Cytophagales bacterium]|nr:hypothetical protein [Cytophagales bacterium]
MRSYFLKSLVLVVFASSLLYLSSCSEDDAKNDLLGSWVAATIVNGSCSDSADDGTTTLTCTTEDCMRLIFTEGSEFEFQITANNATRRQSGTVRIDGSTIDLCEEEEGMSICDRFSFSVNSSSLVLTMNDEQTGCQVRTTYTKEQ